MRAPLRFAAFLLSIYAVPHASAQPVLEDRIRVRHLEPSAIMERVNLLAGLPPQADPRIRLQADDASDTIVISIPQSLGDPLEREQLRLTLREYIHALDQPQQQVELFLYLVQANLLTEGEFRRLDAELRAAPPRIEPGVLPKGVVVHDAVRADNLTMVAVDRTQVEASGQTRPDPVSLHGRILPSLQPDGRVYVAAMLKARAEGEPFAGSQRELEITDRATPAGNQPLIIVAGQKMPLGDAGREAFPGRHEIMLYVWARPAGEAEP